jgi:hypothetical protein
VTESVTIFAPAGAAPHPSTASSPTTINAIAILLGLALA